MPGSHAPAYGSRTNMVDFHNENGHGIIEVKIKDGKGTGTLTPDVLTAITSVAHPDFAGIDSVTVNSIDHSLGDGISLVGSVKHGNGDELQGVHDRTHVITQDKTGSKIGRVVSGHYATTTPNSKINKTFAVVPESERQSEERQTTASLSMSKWLHWGEHANQLKKSGMDKIAHDVRVAEMTPNEPGTSPEVRVLIPHPDGETASVFSQYFHKKRDSICDGMYSKDDSNDVTLPDDSGKPKTFAIMNKEDFDKERAALVSTLGPHTELEKKNGFNFPLVASQPVDGIAHLHFSVARTPMATLLEDDLRQNGAFDDDHTIDGLSEAHVQKAFGEGVDATPELLTEEKQQENAIFGVDSETGSAPQIKITKLSETA